MKKVLFFLLIMSVSLMAFAGVPDALPMVQGLDPFSLSLLSSFGIMGMAEKTTMNIERCQTLGTIAAGAQGGARVQSGELSKIWIFAPTTTTAATLFAAASNITVTLRSTKGDRVLVNAIPLNVLQRISDMLYGTTVFETAAGADWTRTLCIDLGYIRLDFGEYLDILVNNGEVGGELYTLMASLGSDAHLTRCYDLQNNANVSIPNVRFAAAFTAIGTSLIALGAESAITLKQQLLSWGDVVAEDTNRIRDLTPINLTMMEYEGTQLLAQSDICPLFCNEEAGGTYDMQLTFSAAMFVVSISDFVHESSVIQGAKRAGRRSLGVTNRIAKYIGLEKLAARVNGSWNKNVEKTPQFMQIAKLRAPLR